MSRFNEFLSEKMDDPEFKSEYESLEPEFTIIQAMIDDRKLENKTPENTENQIDILK